MKTVKMSFDFTDQPEVAEMLRLYAARKGRTQKAVLVDALKAYFADQLESSLLLRAADFTFAEWENEEDRVYDTF